MNNSTIFTADRNTHVKIVAIALVASVLIAAMGIAARTTTASDSTVRVQATGPALKAGRPVTVSHSETTVIR